MALELLGLMVLFYQSHKVVKRGKCKPYDIRLHRKMIKKHLLKN